MADKYLTVDHLTLKEIQRYFSQITIDPTIHYNGIPCWNWQGTIYKEGYGRTGWRGQDVLIHRLIFAWLVMPLPKRQTGKKTPNLDHLCRNRICCNPIHLEFVPPRVNVLRGVGLGAKNAQKTHCLQGHEFTPENTIWDTPHRRSCRTCRKIKSQQAEYEPKYYQRYAAKLGREAQRARWRATYYRAQARKKAQLSD